MLLIKLDYIESFRFSPPVCLSPLPNTAWSPTPTVPLSPWTSLLWLLPVLTTLLLVVAMEVCTLVQGTLV